MKRPADFEPLGTVHVDSGQLLLIDPCYIDDTWVEEPFEDIRQFRHKESGRMLEYRVDFAKFNAPIQAEGGKTMNDLLATGEWELIEQPMPDGLSYNSVSRTTQNRNGGGTVAMLAAAFSTGYGDGVYQVYVRRGKGEDEGRIMQVLIDFTEVVR